MRQYLELRLHIFAADLLRFNSAPGVIWYHAANGEKRGPRAAAKLKAMGVKPGVADLCLVLPGGYPAFLELKSPKGRQSTAQKSFQLEAEIAGAWYALASSPEEVQRILLEWGAIRPLESRLSFMRAA